MPSLPLKPVSPKISGNRIVYAGLSLLFIAVILLASYAGRSVVTADQWHFLDVISAYYQHGFSFRDVWASHSPHRTPGYKTLFLLDAIYFRLNLKLEIYAGILALLAMAVMIYFHYRESMRDIVSSESLQLSFLVIATVLFSFNQLALYLYSLSALDDFFGNLLFVWLWCYLDGGLRRSLSYEFILKFCVAFLLLLLIFGEGRGVAVILVTLIVMLLSGFYSHAWTERKHKVLIIFTILTSIISQLIYWVVPPKLPPSTRHLFDAMLVVFTQPWGAVKYAVITLGSSILNSAWLHSSSLADSAMYIAGVIVILGYLAAVWLFFRNRMWQKTWLPMIFMLYSILFLGLLLVGRYGVGDLNSAGAPRYAADLQLGLVGILWVFYYARYSSHAVAGSWIKSLAVVSTIFVLIMQAGSIFLGVGLAPYQRKANQHFVHYLITSQPSDYFSSPPAFFCPSPALCAEGVGILRKYGLRPFHPISNPIGNDGANAGQANVGGATTVIAGNLEILKYGPSTIRANIGFHVQANGESALWIMMNQDLQGKAYIVINGTRLPGVHRGNIVSAEIPSSLYSKPGSYPMYVLEVRGNQEIKSSQVDFVVH